MKLARRTLFIFFAVATLAANQFERDLEPNKCAVLSDYLRAEMQRDIYAIQTGKTGSLLSTVTMAFASKAIPNSEREVNASFKSLKKETWQSFRECATRSRTIQRNISAPPLTQFLTPHQMKDVDRILAKRSPDIGYVEFSCVGVDREGTQALFFVQRLRTSNAVGKWVLLARKDPATPWTQVQELVAWIA